MVGGSRERATRGLKDVKEEDEEREETGGIHLIGGTNRDQLQSEYTHQRVSPRSTSIQKDLPTLPIAEETASTQASRSPKEQLTESPKSPLTKPPQSSVPIPPQTTPPKSPPKSPDTSPTTRSSHTSSSPIRSVLENRSSISPTRPSQSPPSTPSKRVPIPDPTVSSSIYSSDLTSITSDLTEIHPQDSDNHSPVTDSETGNLNQTHLIPSTNPNSSLNQTSNSNSLTTLKLGRNFELDNSSDISYNPPSPATMALNQMEVDSTSTTSLPISSLPYFYYTEPHTSNSFDTFDLLDQGNVSQSQYPNTQHHRTNTSALTSPARSNFPSSIASNHLSASIHNMSIGSKQHTSSSGNSKVQSPMSQKHPRSATQQNPGHPVHFPPHLVQFIQQPAVSAGTVPALRDTRLGSEESFFNQVPKRFSQFILDQQNPYIAQRLDNLSVVSQSLYSDYDHVKRAKNTTSSTSKRTKRTFRSNSNTNSNTQPTSSGILGTSRSLRSGGPDIDSVTNSNGTFLSREISNSMGSQATIFSTRPDKGGPTSSGFSKRRRGYNFNFRSRFSKVKTQPIQQHKAKVKVLERSNAMRFKEGGVLYRIRLRIKKMISKLKNLRFNNFRVSSKRFGRSDSVKRSNSLARKKSMIRKKGVTISAPASNPLLGVGVVERVSELDDSLKMEAGAENMNALVSAPPVPPPTNDKALRLSSYIDQQQKKYIRDMHTKSNESSIDYSRHHKLDPKYYQDLPGVPSPTPPVEPSEESEAPPPPPRFVQTPLISSIVSNSEPAAPPLPPKDDPALAQVWKDYLGNVIHKRILLRQEISLYQSFMVDNTTHKFIDVEQEAEEEETKQNVKENPVEQAPQDGLSDLRQTHVIRSTTLTSGTGSSSSKSSSWTSSSWTESRSGTSVLTNEEEVEATSLASNSSPASPLRDPSAQEFSKSLNRRSMLGEMLEYESDTDSALSSSSGSYYSQQASTMPKVLSDINIAKTYAVVPRRHASESGTSNDGSPIKRSSGYQFNLSALQDNE